MIIRLTELTGDLILVNVKQVEAFYTHCDKKLGNLTVVRWGRHWAYVRETVSEISLLLQQAGLVIK